MRTKFPQVEILGAQTEKDQKRDIPDADVFYGIPTLEVYEAAKNLKWIQLAGAGIDGIIGFPGLRDNDVIVTNARGPHVESMANHAISMMLILARNWMDHFRDQIGHRWDVGKYLESQMNISGDTMGILGLGDVGMAIARRAYSFGINVVAVDKHPRLTDGTIAEIYGPERIDDLLAQSDWLVVATPFTNETHNLIDAKKIAKLKNGARVIVVSRGGIVDEDSLIAGLSTGHISGAGLDVFQHEPLSPESPLWDMSNVVITPHCSGTTTVYLKEVEKVFKKNLDRYLKGQPFLYVCNKLEGF